MQDAPPSASASPTPSPTPVITVDEVVETSAVPFALVQAADPNRPAGESLITTAGVPGVLSSTFRVTRIDGVESERVLVSEVVSTVPVDEVTTIGTYVAPPPPPVAAAAPSGCDPNYAGACVPIASDVDCAGGSGNGPAYVSGVVTVVGQDIYDLDRDGDGYGCD